MASPSILSKPHPSRPFLPASSSSSSLRTICCLSSSSSRRCLHLSPSRRLFTRHSSLLSLSPAVTPSSSQPPTPPVAACDPVLPSGFDSHVRPSPQYDGSQQFSSNLLNPESRLDSSSNAAQEKTVETSSVGQDQSKPTVSFDEDSDADGFRYREPTEYDFEIYASNSMEGFVQPPPPLPRFGAVFEDYWGEVIGEDTRPKGDEATIRIRNGLLKYLESLKEAEDKENKNKSRPLFSGSRANNQPRPIVSYRDYLASKEREATVVSQSSSELTSGTIVDPVVATKPTENIAVSSERTLSGPKSILGPEESKPAERKLVPGNNDALGTLPRSRVDDDAPAERRIMHVDRAPSNFTNGDSMAKANMPETNTVSGETVSSRSYGDRNAERSWRDSTLPKNNSRSPTEGYFANDTLRGQSDISFATTNVSDSNAPAAWSRDRNSFHSVDRSASKDFDEGELYDVIGRPVTSRLENTNVAAEYVGTNLDSESVGNAITNKPGDVLDGKGSDLDSKLLEREADSRLLEGSLSEATGRDETPEIKPVHGSWPRKRFGDVEPASKSLEHYWSSDRFGSAKPPDKPAEGRLVDDRFGGAKPANTPLEERRAVDRFGEVESTGVRMKDRWTGDRFETANSTRNNGTVSLNNSSGTSSLPGSRPSVTVSNMVPEPLEIVVDSKGTDRLLGNERSGWEMNSGSTARLIDSNVVDSSLDSKPRELEANAVSTSDSSRSPLMGVDPPVDVNAHNDSKGEAVTYVPRVRDLVLGAVISSRDDKFELEIGAEQPGLMLYKDLRSYLNINLENSFFELPSIDGNQKLEGFVDPLGQSLIVKDRVASDGASPINSIVDFGTVVTAEVQGMSLGEGRAILSARPPARRMAWQRIKQLMQLGDAVNIQIEQYNDGGVLGFLEGVRSFLPRSELLERPENTAALGKYIGRTIPVVILQAEEDTGNIIVSEFMAWKRKHLQLGTVHDATVTRVYAYGMQVEVNNTRLRGFVHISNISKEYVRRVEDLFTEGEKVKVMLIRGRDPHQVSFSISELESDKGLIFWNKQRVFLEAEEMARQFRENLSEDEQQLFRWTIQGVEVKLDGPVIANMNSLHLGNEVYL